MSYYCYNCGGAEKEWVESPKYPPGVSEWRCKDCGTINDPPGL